MSAHKKYTETQYWKHEEESYVFYIKEEPNGNCIRVNLRIKEKSTTSTFISKVNVKTVRSMNYLKKATEEDYDKFYLLVLKELGISPGLYTL